jgi:hypothetical protein
VKTRDFDAVVALARDSVLWRGVTLFVEGWLAAWASSAIVQSGRRVLGLVSSWHGETKLRCAALTTAWAAGGYAVSQMLLPRYVSSGLPIAWAATLVVAALVVAAAPGSFLMAWDAKFGQESRRSGNLEQKGTR